MERSITNQLVNWKDRLPMPLLIRGARQIGKSYAVEAFGAKHFENTLVINFELAPKYKDCFTDLDPKIITQSLAILSNQNINPGKTLLFLDEIQECPQAIVALRYFKEKMPNLHVIAAGSLIEFALQSEEFRMPVGRVQYLFMHPMSFKEFLHAMGQHRLIDFIQNVDWNTNIPNAIHNTLLNWVRQYWILGGMPAVTAEYLKEDNLQYSQQIQTVLLNTYRNDFGKYANKTQHKYLEELFLKAPKLISQHFKYAKISQEMLSRDLKAALKNLVAAGIINPIYATSASGLPLNALINEKKFKLIFVDIGLVNRSMHLDIDLLMQSDLMTINRGAIAEQFVGQELLAYSDPYEMDELFFWQREKKNSQAEVDYVIHIDSKIIPIEVKAGTTGRLKSLQTFLTEKNTSMGIRISQLPFKKESNIISIPFYLISEIRRLITSV